NAHYSVVAARDNQTLIALRQHVQRINQSGRHRQNLGPSVLRLHVPLDQCRAQTEDTEDSLAIGRYDCALEIRRFACTMPAVPRCMCKKILAIRDAAIWFE